MKKIVLATLSIWLLITFNSGAQSKFYTTSCFEFLFQNGKLTKAAEHPDQNIRFSLWFNYTQQFHVDFTKNVGFYSGLALRNVGFITSNESVGITATNPKGVDETIKRRVYTLGVPLAFKLGDFDHNFYIYGGGEYEMVVAYKEKRWENEVKTVKSNFFGDETKRFIPSLFAGIQMPGGLNVQYKCYLSDLLNTDYGVGTRYDQSSFTKSVMQYISVSFNFGPKQREHWRIERKNWRIDYWNKESVKEI